MRFGPAVALIATLLAAPVRAEPPETARWLSSTDLPRDQAGLGGLSGLEVSVDGTSLVALSDRGTLFRGTIARAGETITAIRFDAGVALRGPDGQRLTDTYADPEGLALGPDGRVYISFENQHRVLSYPPDMARATPMPMHRAFRALQLNSGLEAMAMDEAGRLYVVPERSGHVKRPFPVWRLEDGTWTEVFAIPRHPPYLPVGADFGPDGRLYLLERHFAGLGFSSRVRAFELGEGGITAEEVLLETGTGTHGNLEGLAVWQDDTGAIRLTMVSDDNFLGFLPSQIVEYALPLARGPQTH
ncbi:esterase-like activity of phytase family protein [Pseudooceanicola sp.]|uniref:esterase-like activity of phytase family protein n=1 Tax=Pseudooceanicola sp. TaxID=1914328 RepID=UPI00405891A6